MFGLVDAMKEDKADMALVRIACSYGMGATSISVLRKLGELYKEFPVDGEIVRSIPGYLFQHLEKQVLIKQKIAYQRNGHLAFTEQGYSLAKELNEALPVKNLPVPVGVTVNNTLQRLVRDARADWQTMTTLPFFLDKWWWRHTMWNFRKWWAGTNPNQLAKPAPVLLLDRPAWSDEDAFTQYRMWTDSHYTAFWLCPEGVAAGIQKLKEFEDKAVALGPKAAQVIDAVQSIAILSSQLPEPKRLTPIQQIQARMFDKSGDFDVEEVKDAGGKVIARIEWKPTTSYQSEPGRGKSYSSEAFISVSDHNVGATKSEFDKANEEENNAIKALNVGDKVRRKPKQQILIDAFDKAYNSMPIEEMTIEEVNQMLLKHAQNEVIRKRLKHG